MLNIEYLTRDEGNLSIYTLKGNDIFRDGKLIDGLFLGTVPYSATFLLPFVKNIKHCRLPILKDDGSIECIRYSPYISGIEESKHPLDLGSVILVMNKNSDAYTLNENGAHMHLNMSLYKVLHAFLHISKPIIARRYDL